MDPVRITQELDLIAAVKARREALGWSHLETDAKVGLTEGHTGKIEGWDKPWGKRAFTLTPSMQWMLDALGLALVLVPKAMAEELTTRTHATDTVSSYQRRDGVHQPRQMVLRLQARVRIWR